MNRQIEEVREKKETRNKERDMGMKESQCEE